MITLSGVTKRNRIRVAVDDMTFDAAAGRVTRFVGPNGGSACAMRTASRPIRSSGLGSGNRRPRLVRHRRHVGARAIECVFERRFDRVASAGFRFAVDVAPTRRVRHGPSEGPLR